MFFTNNLLTFLQYLKDELLTYIDEANKSLVTKTILFQRNSNADIEHPSSEEIAKRDPSVKRNSALVKKLVRISVTSYG